jgi:outer membrane receptor protein involved in Fe transport
MTIMLLKNDGNIFAKANYQIANKLSLFGDLQLRNVHYKANGAETGMVNDNFNFFNPKAGLNFEINTNNALYFHMPEPTASLTEPIMKMEVLSQRS